MKRRELPCGCRPYHPCPEHDESEIMVHYIDGTSEPVSPRAANRIEWLERGIREIANDYAGTEYDDVAIMLNELLAGREPTAESEYMGINDDD